MALSWRGSLSRWWGGAARRTVSVGLGLLLLAVNLVLANHLAARHHRRFDWTAGRVFSLSPRTARVLHELRRPVRAIQFMMPPDRYQESLYPEVRELLRQMAAGSPLVQLEAIDLDAEPTRAAVLARRYAISAADLRDGVVVLECGGRSKYVPASAMADYAITPEGRKLAAWRGEAALLQALLEVSGDETATVCFARDHGEAPIDSRAPTGFAAIVDEVRRDNYQVRSVDGEQLAAGARGCRVVVLGGPTRAFAPVELDGLERYLRQGGRLFVLLGPVLDRRVTGHRRVGLEPLLAEWGVEVRDNIVVDRLAVPGEPPLMTWATHDGYADHPVGRALEGKLTVWPLTREVRPSAIAHPGRRASGELRVTPLVRTSAAGWAETDLASLRGDRPLQLDPGTDTAGPVSVAVAVEEQRAAGGGERLVAGGGERLVAGGGARLVVLGTERGALNQRLMGPTVRDYNRDLFLAALSWLAGHDRQLGIGPKVPEHLRLILDERQLGRVFLIAVVALPSCSLLLGLLVWWRRRR